MHLQYTWVPECKYRYTYRHVPPVHKLHVYLLVHVQRHASYTCVYAHVYRQVHVHMHIYIYVCMYTHIDLQYTSISVYAYVFTPACIDVNTCTTIKRSRRCLDIPSFGWLASNHCLKPYHLRMAIGSYSVRAPYVKNIGDKARPCWRWVCPYGCKPY